MKRKGFTLIELLAVIVILAVIALIATPMILGMIESTKKGAFLDTGYGIVQSAELYYSEQQLKQEEAKELHFYYVNGESVSE